MIASWYAIIALMLVVFAVFEGWDFGVGAAYFLVARTPAERRQVVAAIGPLWVWHEVWLVAAGGVLLMAFPAVMATAFSGFYIALYLVLWCLLLRGMALEFGGHLTDGMWRDFWDVVLSASSVLLALLFGVAFGNLIRGIPLDQDAHFALALFTDFSPVGDVGILDWYTVSVGVLTVVLLSAHGASYLTLRTSELVQQRSQRLSRWLWTLVVLLLALVTWETRTVRPELFGAALGRPLVWLATLLVAGGATALVVGDRRRRAALHFLGSALVIVGLVGGAFAALFPDLLHSTLDARYSMTATNSAADAHGLALALIWWPIALVATIGYALVNIRAYAGKVGPDAEGANL